MSLQRPSVRDVTIRDRFWTPYLDRIVRVMMPNVFDRLEQDGYLQNFADLTAGVARHQGPPFSDGLLLESIRGASDFLAVRYDSELDARLDRLIGVIAKASETTGDGYISTYTATRHPENRWGTNDGDIVLTHDLYNHGALIEAAVSHYLATGKTALLTAAVRAANTICREIGPAPKQNVVPGHSLPEEAFVKLYRLFRDRRELDGFAAENGVDREAYLAMARFWYAARGDHRGRVLSHSFPSYFSQDHLPFVKQKYAVGHAVRAGLCYTGAAALTAEDGDPAMRGALRSLWRDVYRRKMHVSGGIGARHDIEGFDEAYFLPNKAYLETCAAIAFAFWAGEMNRLDARSEYYDAFERSLCNNILASISEDGKKYFYQNPLESSGKRHRWEWHSCPCCPPMLLKFFSSLGTYLYSAEGEDLYLHLFIGSEWRGDGFSLAQSDGREITVRVTDGKARRLHVRVPEYARNFRLIGKDGRPVACRTVRGYAVLPVKNGETVLRVLYDNEITPRRVFADPRVAADRDFVCVMEGPYLYCAEGIDNAGDPKLVFGKDVTLERDGDAIVGRCADGRPFRLIPYYRWANRTAEDGPDAAMQVWFRQRGMEGPEVLAKRVGDRLYADYTPET